jgi:predicted nucleic acid-binding protein
VAQISIDSYGWIERMVDGPKATKYNQIIDDTSPKDIITSAVVVFEAYRKVKMLAGEMVALEVAAALENTRVIPVDQRIAMEAADFSIEYKLHFSDALVYSTARRFGATLYTSDEDLKSLLGVHFI